MGTKIVKATLVVITISILFKPLWIFDNYNLGNFGEDDLSYWLHSSTLAFDRDLEYIDDYIYDPSNFVPNKNIPYHPPGSAYIISVFVKFFSFFDNDLNKQELRLNPIGSFSYLGFFTGNLFLVLSGLILIKKILINISTYRPILIYLTFLSTIVHFSTTRFLMSHGVEFFLICAILYIFFCFENFKSIHLNFIYFLYFLLLFTRPSTFIYSCLLLILYRKKLASSIENKLQNFFLITIFIYGYLILSNHLYDSYSLLFNPNINETSKSFFEEFNFIEIFSRISKIPNLFFSTNMGIIFSTPIVFIGLFGITKISKIYNSNFDKILFAIYFIAPFLILLVWGGKEVAYGQRLLVGILPISAILSSFYWQTNFRIKFLYPIIINTYLGYLFFYSNQFLTLKEGINLWGVQTMFTAERYYINLYTYFFGLENLIAGFTKNVYFVGFLKFINEDDLIFILKKFSISENSLNNTLLYKTRYESFLNEYFFSYLIIVIIFSTLFVYFFKSPVAKK